MLTTSRPFASVSARAYIVSVYGEVVFPRRKIQVARLLGRTRALALNDRVQARRRQTRLRVTFYFQLQRPSRADYGTFGDVRARTHSRSSERPTPADPIAQPAAASTRHRILFSITGASDPAVD